MLLPEFLTLRDLLRDFHLDRDRPDAMPAGFRHRQTTLRQISVLPVIDADDLMALQTVNRH